MSDFETCLDNLVLQEKRSGMNQNTAEPQERLEAQDINAYCQQAISKLVDGQIAALQKHVDEAQESIIDLAKRQAKGIEQVTEEMFTENLEN